MAGAALHNSLRLGQIEPTFSVMESRASPLDKFTIISVNEQAHRNGDEIDAVLEFGNAEIETEGSGVDVRADDTEKKT